MFVRRQGAYLRPFYSLRSLISGDIEFQAGAPIQSGRKGTPLCWQRGQGRRDETDKKESKRLTRVEVGARLCLFHDLGPVKAAAFSFVNKPNGQDSLALCRAY